MIGRLFILRRRNDLPEMRIPLVILLSAASLLFTAMAGKAFSAGVIMTIAFLPFLTLSVCAYSLIILLWRRTAALLLTPLSFGILYLTGSTEFVAVAISFSVLLISYVHAVSLISRERKFRRLLSLTLTVALCLWLTAVAYAGLSYGTVDEFIKICAARISEVISDILNLHPDDMGVKQLTAKITAQLPAYSVMLSTALAWLADEAVRRTFKLMDCTYYFIRITHRITLPASYALIYTAALVLSSLTSYSLNPLLHVLLRSVTLSMMLPCTAVGVGISLRKLRARIYYTAQKRILTSLLALLILAMMGLSSFCTVLSVAGVYYTLSMGRSRQLRMRKEE